MPLRPVSMERTVREKADEARPWEERVQEDIPDYPYGLTINLSEKELQKLGFARGQLDAGDEVRLIGFGMVTAASAETINGRPQFEARIQIQSLGIEKVEEEPSVAQTLYGE